MCPVGCDALLQSWWALEHWTICSQSVHTLVCNVSSRGLCQSTRLFAIRDQTWLTQECGATRIWRHTVHWCTSRRKTTWCTVQLSDCLLGSRRFRAVQWQNWNTDNNRLYYFSETLNHKMFLDDHKLCLPDVEWFGDHVRRRHGVRYTY